MSAQSITSCLKFKVKRSCRYKVRGCALNSVEHPHGGGNHQHVSQPITFSRQVPPGSETSENFFSHPRERHDRGCGDGTVCERNTFNITGVVTGGDHTDIGSGTTCGPYTLAPCAHQVKPFTEYPECSSSENSTPSLFACSESSYLKAYRDDKQKNSAAYSLSTVEGIQQVSRSRQYSRRGSVSAVRCGRAPRVDQIVDTNRSRRGVGAQLYIPHLLDNRSTSSSVRKAGALVPPSSCLDGGPHGWVPVDTHSTPVLTSVRRLWVAYVVYEPNTQQEHAQLAHGSGARVQDHDPGTSQPETQTPRQSAAQQSSKPPPVFRTPSEYLVVALDRCSRMPRRSYTLVRRTQRPSCRATRLVSKTHW